VAVELVMSDASELIERLTFCSIVA
jgi:hypothetical protein